MNQWTNSLGRSGWAVWLLLVLHACSRDANTAPLAAAFDAGTSLGEVRAQWNNSGEERAFAGAIRLKEPEVRFSYRVDVRNRSGDKLFVHLENFQLVGGDGLPIAQDTASVACTLGTGETPGVLTGEVWVPKPLAQEVRGFRASPFAVALSDRARDRYRAWRLQGQPEQAAQIDAELARYAAAAPCTPH